MPDLENSQGDVLADFGGFGLDMEEAGKKIWKDLFEIKYVKDPTTPNMRYLRILVVTIEDVYDSRIPTKIRVNITIRDSQGIINAFLEDFKVDHIVNET